MRKFALCLALLFSFVALSASAAPIAIGNALYLTDVNNNTSGGTFRVNAVPDNAFDEFLTFCVQRGETVRLNETIYVKNISNNVMGLDPVPLSEGAAYLYWHFINAPSVIGYTGSSVDNDELQYAIWNFQSITPWNASRFYDPAQTAVTNGWRNNGRVQVLNLVRCEAQETTERTSFDGCVDVQDQLVTTPVPEPGSISMMLMGLASVFGMRKRLSRK